MPRHRGRHRVRIEALVVAGDGHEPRTGEREALQRREVGRLLDEHRVAGLEQRGGDERQCLLGARAHEHVVRGRVRPRPPSRAAIAARNAGSPSVVEYCSVAGEASAAANASASPARSKSSGAGRPPANETTPGRAVSARISRTGELWTPARRAAGGGGGAAGAVTAGSSTDGPYPTPAGRRECTAPRTL